MVVEGHLVKMIRKEEKTRRRRRRRRRRRGRGDAYLNGSGVVAVFASLRRRV